MGLGVVVLVYQKDYLLRIQRAPNPRDLFSMALPKEAFFVPFPALCRKSAALSRNTCEDVLKIIYHMAKPAHPLAQIFKNHTREFGGYAWIESDSTIKIHPMITKRVTVRWAIDPETGSLVGRRGREVDVTHAKHPVEEAFSDCVDYIPGAKRIRSTWTKKGNCKRGNICHRCREDRVQVQPFESTRWWIEEDGAVLSCKDTLTELKCPQCGYTQ